MMARAAFREQSVCAHEVARTLGVMEPLLEAGYPVIGLEPSCTVMLQDEITEWRRDFHAHPELLYDVHRTAGIVADKL